jgi:ERCC4-type nuclease
MYEEIYKGFNKNFKIIIDTREKKNSHITNYFDREGINYINKKMDSGDYSFELDGLTFESKLIIERKACIDEICNNFTRHRERFEREFQRIKEDSFVILLIENSTIDMIKEHKYRSKMHPNSLLGSLKSWQKKYNIITVFCNKSHVGKFIYQKCISYLKKYYITPEVLKEINNHLKDVEQIKLDV